MNSKNPNEDSSSEDSDGSSGGKRSSISSPIPKVKAPRKKRNSVASPSGASASSNSPPGESGAVKPRVKRQYNRKSVASRSGASASSNPSPGDSDAVKRRVKRRYNRKKPSAPPSPVSPPMSPASQPDEVSSPAPKAIGGRLGGTILIDHPPPPMNHRIQRRRKNRESPFKARNPRPSRAQAILERQAIEMVNENRFELPALQENARQRENEEEEARQRENEAENARQRENEQEDARQRENGAENARQRENEAEEEIEAPNPAPILHIDPDDDEEVDLLEYFSPNSPESPLARMIANRPTASIPTSSAQENISPAVPTSQFAIRRPLPVRPNIGDRFFPGLGLIPAKSGVDHGLQTGPSAFRQYGSANSLASKIAKCEPKPILKSPIEIRSENSAFRWYTSPNPSKFENNIAKSDVGQNFLDSAIFQPANILPFKPLNDDEPSTSPQSESDILISPGSLSAFVDPKVEGHLENQSAGSNGEAGEEDSDEDDMDFARLVGRKDSRRTQSERGPRKPRDSSKQ